MARFNKRHKLELAFIHGKIFGTSTRKISSFYNQDKTLQDEFDRGVKEAKMMRLLNGD